jgi:hypothetical protein
VLEANVRSRMGGGVRRDVELIPGTSVWVVYSWVYVTQVDLAHEAIDLEEGNIKCSA